MIDPASARQAAQLLMQHHGQGTRLRELPPALRPSSRAEGYAIQAEWMAGSARPLFGWKIAATSAAGQRHINVDGPIAGRVLAESVVPDGAVVPLAGNQMRVAELELAFRMGADLPPRAQRYGVDEVMAAVATLHPAIEIPDSRYEDFCAVGAPQLIADNACGHRFMLGAAAAFDWRARDLAAHAVAADVAGKSHHEGHGRNALGDPRVALAWLVNELCDLGLTLRAGEVVTTGTCVVPIQVVPGDRVTADFGELGTLAVGFA
ncbi:MAG: fumarylacetoacetate hydrolase family protein [Burkholderiales bacterium]